MKAIPVFERAGSASASPVLVAVDELAVGSVPERFQSLTSAAGHKERAGVTVTIAARTAERRKNPGVKWHPVPTLAASLHVVLRCSRWAK